MPLWPSLPLPLVKKVPLDWLKALIQSLPSSSSTTWRAEYPMSGKQKAGLWALQISTTGSMLPWGKLRLGAPAELDIRVSGSCAGLRNTWVFKFSLDFIPEFLTFREHPDRAGVLQGC